MDRTLQSLVTPTESLESPAHVSKESGPIPSRDEKDEKARAIFAAIREQSNSILGGMRQHGCILPGVEGNSVPVMQPTAPGTTPPSTYCAGPAQGSAGKLPLPAGFNKPLSCPPRANLLPLVPETTNGCETADAHSSQAAGALAPPASYTPPPVPLGTVASTGSATQQQTVAHRAAGQPIVIQLDMPESNSDRIKKNEADKIDVPGWPNHLQLSVPGPMRSSWMSRPPSSTIA